MKSKQAPAAQVARKRRAATDLARGMQVLLNLRDSLAQSRTRGITLEAAKGRLADRLAAERSAGSKKATRSSRPSAHAPGGGRRAVSKR